MKAKIVFGICTTVIGMALSYVGGSFIGDGLVECIFKNN